MYLTLQTHTQNKLIYLIFITSLLLVFFLLTSTQYMFLSIGTIPEGGRACGLGKEALLDNAVVTNIFVLHDREVLP